MNKNLSTVNQNNKLMLKKSKSLMSITNSILSKDDWMQSLWVWADKNYIFDYDLYSIDGDDVFWGGLPRNKNALADLKNLAYYPYHDTINTLISYDYKLYIPNEIENLVNLTNIVFWGYDEIIIPKEIGKLVNLTKLDLDCFNLLKLPKEIGNLVNLESLHLRCDGIMKIPKEIGNLTSLTKLSLSKNKLVEIGSLTNLEELYLYENELTKFPDEIINLTNLVKLDFEDNIKLVLNEEQKEWIRQLISNGCDVTMNELARRYMYLDEFNIGREVPITPEILDDDIPAEITAKLADGILTFEEYLDEAAEYLDNVSAEKDKEKFHRLVIKIYERNEALGKCFERNITFNSYEDNKLTWTSIATGEDKEMLVTHWGIINMFVKDIFGYETKIINIPMKKRMEK